MHEVTESTRGPCQLGLGLRKTRHRKHNGRWVWERVRQPARLALRMEASFPAGTVLASCFLDGRGGLAFGRWGGTKSEQHLVVMLHVQSRRGRGGQGDPHSVRSKREGARPTSQH